MAKTDPTSEAYQATTNCIMVIGFSLLAFGLVIGPALCVLLNAL